MGSISLPALHINPPQAPENPLDQVGRLLQLRQAMQNGPLQTQALQQQVQTGQLENQQKRTALQDQQAVTKALQSWDGKDYNQLAPLILKNGGSGQAVLGLKQKAAEYQSTVATTLKNNADAGLAQVNAEKTKNDMFQGAITSLDGVPDAQLPQAIQQTAQDLQQKGILDPQHAQAAAQLAQVAAQNPQQARSQLDLMRKSSMLQSQITDEALKKAQTSEAASRSNEADINAQKSQMEMQLGTGPMADSRYRNILMNQSLGRPVSPDDKAFLSAYKQQKTLVPTAQINLQAGLLSQGAKEMAAQNYQTTGQLPSGMRSPAIGAQILNQAASGGPVNVAQNAANYKTALKQQEAFTSGNYSQQLNSINTAREHMKTFTSLADALGNSDVQAVNKVGNALGVQFGSDKATNFGIAKQAFMSEVGKAFAGAGVTLADRQEIGNQISAASSPAQLRGAAQTADALLAGKQRALQSTYQQGQGGKPNFGEQNYNDPFAQFGGKAH